MLKIAETNFPLVKYLLQQGTQSMADRMKVMRIFYPNAKVEDWKLVDAGIRVQAIKKTDGEAGIVHFGTEVLTSADKSMSALLGASPGASVCVNIVTEVIGKSFPHLTESEAGLDLGDPLDRMDPHRSGQGPSHRVPLPSSSLR